MANLVGHISQIIGPVVDVHFNLEPGAELPRIHEALSVLRANGRTLIIEVQQRPVDAILIGLGYSFISAADYIVIFLRCSDHCTIRCAVMCEHCKNILNTGIVLCIQTSVDHGSIYISKREIICCRLFLSYSFLFGLLLRCRSLRCFSLSNGRLRLYSGGRIATAGCECSHSNRHNGKNCYNLFQCFHNNILLYRYTLCGVHNQARESAIFFKEEMQFLQLGCIHLSIITAMLR